MEKVPFHNHNNSDGSPYLNPKYFLPFPSFKVANARTAPTDIPKNGTIRYLYDGTYYVEWSFVNNGWRYLLMSTPFFANPMTTKGDIVIENATPAPDRLPIGSSGQLLTVVAGLPAWTSFLANNYTTTIGYTTGGTKTITCGFQPTKVFFNGYVSYAGNYVTTNGFYTVSGPVTGSTYMTIQSGALQNSSTVLGGDGTAFFSVSSTNSTTVTLSVTCPAATTIAGVITVI